MDAMAVITAVPFMSARLSFGASSKGGSPARSRASEADSTPPANVTSLSPATAAAR
jgi:hypothetical protein